MDSQNEESFLCCPYKKIKRYGSTNDFHPLRAALHKYNRVLLHKVAPTDTLQNLGLKYNVSIFVIKRLNKLWSDQSIFCREYILIPLIGDQCSPEIKMESVPSTSNLFSTGDKKMLTRIVSSSYNLQKQHQVPETRDLSSTNCSVDRIEEGGNESLDQLFKRIDLNVKRTRKVVNKLANSPP